MVLTITRYRVWTRWPVARGGVLRLQLVSLSLSRRFRVIKKVFFFHRHSAWDGTVRVCITRGVYPPTHRRRRHSRRWCQKGNDDFQYSALSPGGGVGRWRGAEDKSEKENTKEKKTKKKHVFELYKQALCIYVYILCAMRYNICRPQSPGPALLWRRYSVAATRILLLLLYTSHCDDIDCTE